MALGVIPLAKAEGNTSFAALDLNSQTLNVTYHSPAVLSVRLSTLRA